MNNLRERIQSEAEHKLKENNYNGCIVLSPGTGKSKVAIDCIKQGNFKNILITSPRTNLKENWRNELKKWGIYKRCEYEVDNTEYDGQCGTRINITLENIQTVFRWSEKLLKQFDLIIVDKTLSTLNFSN